MAFSLSIWTVYNDPLDYPGKWVARRFEVRAGSYGPTEDLIVVEDLITIREEMQRRGLTYLPRYQDDDPKIFECWI